MERVCFKSSTVDFLSLLLDKSPLDQTRRYEVIAFAPSLRIFAQVRVNLPAVKRRVESLAGRRTVKQQWQVHKYILLQQLVRPGWKTLGMNVFLNQLGW